MNIGKYHIEIIDDCEEHSGGRLCQIFDAKEYSRTNGHCEPIDTHRVTPEDLQSDYARTAALAAVLTEYLSPVSGEGVRFCGRCSHCESIDPATESGICGPLEGEYVLLSQRCICPQKTIDLVESLQAERDAKIKAMQESRALKFTTPRDALKAILRIILDHDFSVGAYTEGEDDAKHECGLELENWTEGGVDMPCFIDLRKCLPNPYDPADLLKGLRSYADDFDVDNFIEAHREDQRYKDTFTICESVRDFTFWLRGFSEMVTDAENALNPYLEALYAGLINTDTPDLEDGTFATILDELIKEDEA